MSSCILVLCWRVGIILPTSNDRMYRGDPDHLQWSLIKTNHIYCNTSTYSKKCIHKTYDIPVESAPFFRSINLILCCISPYHSHHLRSHHLSFPLPFTPDLKLISAYKEDFEGKVIDNAVKANDIKWCN